MHFFSQTLLSRVPLSSTSGAISGNLDQNSFGYHQSTRELFDEETEFYTASQTSDDNLDDGEDEDPVAIINSPDSLDQTQSPEDLLAHRLSGQCHTSFDLTYWHEFDEDPRLNTASSTDQPNRTVAHLEEVVFDVSLRSYRCVLQFLSVHLIEKPLVIDNNQLCP